ncbi:MAG: PorV/PorQ family protein [Fibrobacter sp.]|nr:PorV/PorQ family protein [Fibrobacter sp.]
MFRQILCRAFFMAVAGSTSLFAGGDFWKVDQGGTTMKFLSMPVSPRTAALAGAGIASPENASEASRNPVATAASSEAHLGVNQILFSDITAANFTSVYFGNSFRYLNMSASLEFLNYDDLEGRDENGFLTGDFGAGAWALQLGVGSTPSAFRWGLSARFASETIENASAFAFLADAGGAFQLNRYVSFGAAIRNFGWVSEYESEKEYAPLSLQAGVTGIYPVTSAFSLALHADAYRRTDYQAEWLLGSEIAYKKILVLRGGYAFRGDTDGGVSGGLGIRAGALQLDYAYSARPAVGGNHHIGLGLYF